MEKTLIILKPDSVQRKLVGKIIDRLEQNNLKIKAMKMLDADLDTLKEHYPDSMIPVLGSKGLGEDATEQEKRQQGEKIVGWLRDYMTSGPIVPMVVEGENAIKEVRRIVGATDPSKAEQGTIRGDFGNDSIEKANQEQRSCQNLIHASGNPEEAENEINIWFKPDELC